MRYEFRLILHDSRCRIADGTCQAEEFVAAPSASAWGTPAADYTNIIAFVIGISALRLELDRATESGRARRREAPHSWVGCGKMIKGRSVRRTSIRSRSQWSTVPVSIGAREAALPRNLESAQTGRCQHVVNQINEEAVRRRGKYKSYRK